MSEKGPEMDLSTAPVYTYRRPEAAPESPEFMAWYLAEYFWNLTIGDPKLPKPIQEAWFLVNLWYSQDLHPGHELACKLAITTALKRGDWALEIYQ